MVVMYGTYVWYLCMVLMYDLPFLDISFSNLKQHLVQSFEIVVLAEKKKNIKMYSVETNHNNKICWLLIRRVTQHRVIEYLNTLITSLSM